MDTIELLKDLYFINKEYKKLNKKPLHFNVLPSDYLKHEKISSTAKTILVANTQSSRSKGEHWLCMHFYPQKHVKNKTKVVCLYFDSYGLEPRLPAFKTFIKKNSDILITSKKTLQGPFSSTCGMYCVVLLWYLSKNMKLNTFLNKFSDKDFDANDRRIAKMYQKIFGALHTNHNKKKKRTNQFGGMYNLPLCNQTCRPLLKRN